MNTFFKPYVISIIGYKRAGKSTLAQRLLEELEDLHLRTAYIKEMPKADMSVVPDFHTTCKVYSGHFVFESSFHLSFDVEEFINNHLNQYRLVLVEGFDREKFDKIEVVDNTAGKKKIISTPEQGLFAFVLRTPGIFLPEFFTDIPRFSFNNVRDLAEMISDKVSPKKKKRKEYDITLRPPTGEDAEVMHDMFIRMFIEEQYTSRLDLPEFEQIIDNFYHTCVKQFGTEGQMLADVEGETAGFMWVVKINHFITQEPMGMVGNVYVYEKHRRKGIARKLMEWAEDWSKERGCTRMTLNVFSNNAGAVNLYERLGYKMISQTMEKEI